MFSFDYFVITIIRYYTITKQVFSFANLIVLLVVASFGNSNLVNVFFHHYCFYLSTHVICELVKCLLIS